MKSQKARILINGEKDENGEDRIGIIVLAAGSSVRFHGDKLLAEFEGKRLYKYLFDTLYGYGYPVTVVTGYDEIEEDAREHGWYTVRNERPEEGISRSIRLGISCLLEKENGLAGIIFCVCDQPFLSMNSLERMIQAFWRTKKGIVCMQSHGVPGNPNLFSQRYWNELTELTGDQGGRVVIRRNPEDLCLTAAYGEWELEDIDRREDLLKMKIKV